MTSLVKSAMGSSNGPGRAPSTLQAQAVALAQPGRYGVLRDTHPASPAPPSYQVQVGAYARVQDAGLMRDMETSEWVGREVKLSDAGRGVNRIEA